MAQRSRRSMLELHQRDRRHADVITINEDGSLITRFKVMIRPLKAIELVHRPMFE